MDAEYREQQIDAPEPVDGGLEAWVELVFRRAGNLGGKQLRLAAAVGGQDGQREEHYAQASYPVGHRPPE